LPAKNITTNIIVPKVAKAKTGTFGTLKIMYKAHGQYRKINAASNLDAFILFLVLILV
jgi:hypothetical protein